MTDRYNALTVVLEENIREDDAEALIGAIRQLKGVQDVVPNVADINSVVADSRARLELLDALICLVRKEKS
jgi:hypothetical protein